MHSFITEIYIAPLQGYYSEALPQKHACSDWFHINEYS